MSERNLSCIYYKAVINNWIITVIRLIDPLINQTYLTNAMLFIGQEASAKIINSPSIDNMMSPYVAHNEQ